MVPSTERVQTGELSTVEGIFTYGRGYMRVYMLHMLCTELVRGAWLHGLQFKATYLQLGSPALRVWPV